MLGHCRERMTLAKSPLGQGGGGGGGGGGGASGGGECSSVLTFQQVISGAVSPQYTTSACILGGGQQPLPGEQLRGSSTALAAVAEDTTTSGPDATADSSDDEDDGRPQMGQQLQLHLQGLSVSSTAAHFMSSQQRERGVGESSSAASAVGVNPPQQLHCSSATIAAAAQFSIRMAERQRLRTSSMPAESRKVSAL